MTFVYTICPNRKEAEEMGKKLVKEKLAACVNIWRITSIYRWQEKVTQEKEFAVLIKTNGKNFKTIEQFICKHHSYQTPAIIEISGSNISKAYATYISKSTK